MKVQNKKFTLIELIIVIVVIAILAGMALPKFIGVRRNAQVAAMERDLDTIEKAVALYNLDSEDNSYPFKEPTTVASLNKELPTVASLNDSLATAASLSDNVSTVSNLKDTVYEVLETIGDDGTEIYQLDMELLEPYIQKLKYDDENYLYSLQSGTAIHEDGKVDGKNSIHHILGIGISDKKEDIVEDGVFYEVTDAGSTANWKSYTHNSYVPQGGDIKFEWATLDELTTTRSIEENIDYDKLTWTDDFSKLVNSRYLISRITVKSPSSKDQTMLKDYKVNYILVDDTITPDETPDETPNPTPDETPEQNPDTNPSDPDVDTGVTLIDKQVLATGQTHTLAIGKDGELYAWGRNFYKQLGDGTTVDKKTPTLITLPNNVKPVAVAAGKGHSLAIGEDGELYGWGWNVYGEVGQNTTATNRTPDKVTLAEGVKPVYITAMENTSMAIGDDGNIYAWGYGGGGILGVGSQSNLKVPTKTLLPEGVKATSISLGGYHALAIGDNGKLYSWGKNNYAQVGNNSTTLVTTPIEIELPDGAKPVKICAGSTFSLVLADDGKVYGWGRNEYDELGFGSLTYQKVPREVTLLSGEELIAFSAYAHNVTITKSGQLCTWGSSDSYGELGTGTKGNGSKKNIVSLPDNVRATYISTGENYTMIIGENGKLYAVGKNNYGQLGIGTTITSLEMVIIGETDEATN